MRRHCRGTSFPIGNEGMLYPSASADNSVTVRCNTEASVYQAALVPLIEDPNVNCPAVRICRRSAVDSGHLVTLLPQVIGKGKPLMTRLMNTGWGRGIVEQL